MHQRSLLIKQLYTTTVVNSIENYTPNKDLVVRPPQIIDEEVQLARNTITTLAQFISGKLTGQ